MTLTQRELEALVNWARSGSRRVRIKFKGLKYSVLISRYVEAVDAAGRRVPWQVAFGSRPPHDVLSSFSIEEIAVDEAGSSKTFATMSDLLKHAGIRR
ncbi:MAG: hypothetical protein QXF46_07575 [Thermofilaceae archaeon]